MEYSLEGNWKVQLPDGFCGEMTLPGTLDENRIGYRDTGSNQWHPADHHGDVRGWFNPENLIATRYTRNYTFEGEARLTKRIRCTEKPGKRVFLEAERARVLRLFLDGQEVPHFIPPSISTPQVFEVTGKVDGEHEIMLLSDNSYPGLPHDAIVFSSAATDETQTNWNGVLGYLRLREEEDVFVEAVQVYTKNDTLTVKIEMSAAHEYTGMLQLSSEAFAVLPLTIPVTVSAGRTELMIEKLALSPRTLRWDEYEGKLYLLTARLSNGSEKTVRFGVRDFGDNGAGRLALNGRTIFLRGEANCAVFPEEGHPPMGKNAWLEILERYKSYGVNCMRFHSYCPPEAAFAAADELGMLMQPELSHWNPENAFEDEESFACYQTEMTQILKMLANHPSFVMLTFGNELWAHEKGLVRMHQMLAQAHEMDDTRLYSYASNGFYGTEGCDRESDFYTAQCFCGQMLRGTSAAIEKEKGIQGHINNRYPDARVNYDEAMEQLRGTYAKPVFGFEVGQFESLPDFRELEDFHGISRPDNLRLIQKRAEKCGLLKEWNRFVEATGELALIGYREEIEAVMRTREMSGISLLGLQDFPGQGTALVGMLNSHLQPKPWPFACPERFQAFFRSELVLAELPRYTFESDEVLKVKLTVANYGKREICAPVRFELEQKQPGHSVLDRNIFMRGNLPEAHCPVGTLTEVGELAISFSADGRNVVRLDGTVVEYPAKFFLHVQVGAARNSYPIWVYPSSKTEVTCPEKVYETAVFDTTAKKVLESGGIVYLTPPATAEALPSSIKTQFTTDFWSVGTFPAQEGGMGQLIDAAHPLFEYFPTEFHTDWQWWPMATQRAIILPEYKKSIVAEMDSYAYMRPMTQLLECRCSGGRLLLSSMGLQNLQQYPEARALRKAIYRYLESDKFLPEQEIEMKVIAGLVSGTA
ncbi:MAG: hypothetical protein LUG93_18630 [Lachnospiraceae bacterium]|nr:hypothetical protein [Lachnospiraceae bacterium]